jgi:hypothetical protein
MRTAQQGLLAAANAVREGRDIKAVLTRSRRARNPTWYAPGFRLLEIHARNAGLVAWAIANEMSQWNGQTAILTPDAGNRLLRTALSNVQTRTWNREGEQTFGPFPFTWESQDDEIAAALLAGIPLPPTATYADFCAVLRPFAVNAPVAHAMSRMDRLRRVRGQNDFTSLQVTDLVRDAVRNHSRLGFRQHRRNLAMTIHRAKNREFQNVVVLWPHTATGSPEHLRKLLYNGITRAISHCAVIVLGRGRLDAPPFAPPTAL